MQIRTKAGKKYSAWSKAKIIKNDKQNSNKNENEYEYRTDTRRRDTKYETENDKHNEKYNMCIRHSGTDYLN